jgi:hypothetical protein
VTRVCVLLAVQLDAAIEFLRTVPSDGVVDEAAFATACGFGIEVSKEEVEAAVAREIEAKRAVLVEQRYLFTHMTLLVRRAPRLSAAVEVARPCLSHAIPLAVDDCADALRPCISMCGAPAESAAE